MRGRGQVWAYAGAFAGGSVSVAANVAHSFRPPKGATAYWTPQGGAVALAAFWPLALLLAIEVLGRVAWPTGVRWILLRWFGLAPVAFVAAIVSYRHLSGLLDWYGEDPITVTIGPLAVDGLMVISTGALLALAHAVAERPIVEDPIPDPIPEPVEDPIPDPIVVPVETEDSGRVDRPAAGSVRALVLADRVARSVVSAAIGEEDDYLVRARVLIREGILPASPSAERIMAALKPCGPKRARAIRDAIKGEEVRASPRVEERDRSEGETGTSGETPERSPQGDERRQLSE